VIEMPPQQRQLFTEAPWEHDDASERLVASVVFPGPLPGEFDYLVPEHLREKLAVGRRVRAPLGKGNRAMEAYCVRVEYRPVAGRELKSLLSVIDARTLLSPSMLRLTAWMADRYLCSWGQVLEAVLPAGVRAQAGTRMARYVALPEAWRERWRELKLSSKQQHVLRLLTENTTSWTVPELARVAGCSTGPILGLIAKGYLQAETRRTAPLAPAPESGPPEQNLALNPAQAAALAAIQSALHRGEHEELLLYGVTGSGKTEVYIQAIQEVVRFGRQALVLVPEISLTPQTLERFRARFARVAVLHSHLSDVERHSHWERIALGEIQVVIGARSAVFAPIPRLGLIVLDEEHESSFKQEHVPRYHARAVAQQRAIDERVPLVLGSATPSLESWQRARNGQSRLLSLPLRVESRPMPHVALVDLRNEFRQAITPGALTRPLRQQMRLALEAGEQVILLLNRRGFSTHIQCPACGHAVRCPHCEIALTYHRLDELVLCHYCDYQTPAPPICPECRYPGIRYSGKGTQRLEAEVRQQFPDYPCLRMDTDTMQGRGAHQRALEAFRSGQVRILLGTQMIAKGLDFPSVTLVGVVNADLALHLPDFRAAERTFQLLAQVAGRAGRGDKGGRVLVQTFSPEHPALQFATRHDFEGFAAQELPLREGLAYPPFGSMIRLVVRGPIEQVAADAAQALATRLKLAADAHAPRSRVLGPAPAPLAKLRDRYRYHLQFQGPQSDALRAAVRAALDGFRPPGDIDWMADVDPLSML